MKHLIPFFICFVQWICGSVGLLLLSLNLKIQATLKIFKIFTQKKFAHTNWNQADMSILCDFSCEQPLLNYAVAKYSLLNFNKMPSAQTNDVANAQ